MRQHRVVLTCLLALVVLVTIKSFASLRTTEILSEFKRTHYSETATPPHISARFASHAAPNDRSAFPAPPDIKLEKKVGISYGIYSPKHWVPDWYYGNDTGQVLDARRRQIIER